jgi:hypothetical protein
MNIVSCQLWESQGRERRLSEERHHDAKGLTPTLGINTLMGKGTDRFQQVSPRNTDGKFLHFSRRQNL